MKRLLLVFLLFAATVSGQTVRSHYFRHLKTSAGITGTSGVWANVTPGDMDLNGASSGGSNFGANANAIIDPVTSGVAYTFADFQGAWRSTDYGLTWTKRSAGGSLIEGGKIWAAAIAPDASYILTGGLFQQCTKSTDGGATWFAANASLAFDPYGYDIDPLNANHVIATSHNGSDGHLYESANAGATWADRGAMGAMSNSAYAYFGLTASTIIAVSDGDAGAGAGTLRGTWNGSAWSWSSVNVQQHYHGSHQLYVDRTNGNIFNAGAFGIYKSANDGVSWTQVSTRDSGAVASTATVLYAGRSYATQGSFAPQFQHASAPTATSWTNDSDPGGMSNGPKSMIDIHDGSGRHALIANAWNFGVWRYVE